MICAVGEVCCTPNALGVSGLSPVAVGSPFGRFFEKKKKKKEKEEVEEERVYSVCIVLFYNDNNN